MPVEKKSKTKKISTIIAVALKSTKLIKIIQLIKLMKFAKPFVMILSMMISILAYSAIWSPAFAIAFVVLLAVHEMGHVIAMNKEGFPTNAPVFIPFVGAMLFSPKDMDRRQEAVIGIGGPILGSIASFILLGIYYFYPSNYILIFAYMGLFLNLFQMIPLSPLDGGRVTQAIGRNFQFVGIILLMAITVLLHQPTILLIWIIVLFDFTFLSFKQRIISASIIELTLIVFTLLRIGIEDNFTYWTCIVDSLVGFIYILMIISSWRNDKIGVEEVFSQSTNRASLDRKQKIFWLGIFISTITILISALFLISPLLKAVKL